MDSKATRGAKRRSASQHRSGILAGARLKPAAMGIASLSFFGAEGGVFAQTPGRGEATLPEVSVQDKAGANFRTDSTSSATRTETPMRDIPQFINTVPQSLIRSQGATTLQDALRNVPGISYAAAEGGTQANQVFYLRGFPAGGDLFLDGIRDIGEYNRDLFATESVEVLKGPSALSFGRGSTGGVINQTSKTANLLPMRELSVTVGSFDQKRATADLNFKIGDTSAARIVALGEDSGSFRYPQDVNKVGFAPSLLLGLGERTRLTLSYFYLKTSDVTDYGQPSLTPAYTGTTQFAMPPVSARAYYGFTRDYADHETSIATLRFEHAFSDSLSVRETLRWANYKRQVEATIATLRATDANGNAVNAATPAYLLMVTRNHDGGRTRDNDDGSLISQTELTWKTATGSVKHTVLTGLELGRETLNRWNYTLDASPAAGIQIPTAATPLLAPDPTDMLAYTKTANIQSRARGETTAVYVQDQLEFTPQWKALLGLRWENYETKASQNTISNGLYTAGPFSSSDTMLSGRGGLIWQPTQRQSYYVSYGNSYNPSGELGVYGGTGTNLNLATQDLDPEENRNYEVGAQWDLLPGLQLRSAIFRNEKTNARMPDPVTGTTTVLAGKRRVDGVELELSGAITSRWSVYGGLAYMDGEIVTGPAAVQGRTPLGVPDFAASVWTVYRLGDGWEVGGGLRGSSPFWLNDANTGEVPGYVVADATIAYVQRNYEIRLNAYNLADKTYYIGGYNNNPNRVLPGVPRSASLTLRYNFN